MKFTLPLLMGLTGLPNFIDVNLHFRPTSWLHFLLLLRITNENLLPPFILYDAVSIADYVASYDRMIGK
jgi:hypothetical protein